MHAAAQLFPDVCEQSAQISCCDLRTSKEYERIVSLDEIPVTGKKWVVSQKQDPGPVRGNTPVR